MDAQASVTTPCASTDARGGFKSEPVSLRQLVGEDGWRDNELEKIGTASDDVAEVGAALREMKERREQAHASGEADRVRFLDSWIPVLESRLVRIAGVAA